MRYFSTNAGSFAFGFRLTSLATITLWWHAVSSCSNIFRTDCDRFREVHQADSPTTLRSKPCSVPFFSFDQKATKMVFAVFVVEGATGVTREGTSLEPTLRPDGTSWFAGKVFLKCRYWFVKFLSVFQTGYEQECPGVLIVNEKWSMVASLTSLCCSGEAGLMLAWRRQHWWELSGITS